MIPLKTDSPLPLGQRLQVMSESEQRRLKLKKATQAFEAIFISQLMKSMRATSFTKKEEDGFGKDIMLSMADESVSRQLAKQGVLGIGKLLFEHLSERLSDGSGVESPERVEKVTTDIPRAATKETPHADPPRQLKVVAPETTPALVEPPAVPVSDDHPAPQPASEAVDNKAEESRDDELPVLSKYIEHIRAAAAETNLPENLLKSMIMHESGGDVDAVSRKGAAGLMQLMPDTAKAMGVEDSLDPKENIMGGAKYMRSLLDRFGDLRTALAAYNAGPTAVARNGGKAPFAETGKYVEAILSDFSKGK